MAIGWGSNFSDISSLNFKTSKFDEFSKSKKNVIIAAVITIVLILSYFLL